MSCIFPECDNTKHYCKKTDIRFFHFPALPYMRQKWLKACKRKEEDLPKVPLVCSKHFVGKDIYLDKKYARLNKNAVPRSSINNNNLKEDDDN
ncbi:hypothetical protein DOY81_014299, partial [Sarcophaga bullata]